MLNRREFLGGSAAAAVATGMKSGTSRPNIVYILADNFYWNHVGAYGCKAIKTPHFDRVAREGVLFTRAFCNSPSCSPSRAAMLTGQDIWRLEQGGNLWGELPKKFPIYPDLLEKAGYWVGYAGKGYAPGSTAASGRKHNPAGPKFNEFGEFLLKRPKGKPFCFWYGGGDSNQFKAPVIKQDVDLSSFEFPSYLPVVEETRNDFYQYFQRLRQFDSMIGTLLSELEATGELDNTIIAVAADNGGDQPGGYPNLYDSGTREFFAIRWGAQVPPGRTVSDFVTLADLAPTFLEAAGVHVPSDVTARSLMPILRSTSSGQVDPSRSSVALGRERHAWARVGGMGYPMRALRNSGYLYIRNYEPDRWPAGDPGFNALVQSYYGDVDQTESKWYILKHKDELAMTPYYNRIFAKRPAEELFDVKADPDQMQNLADDPRFYIVKKHMATELTTRLKRTGDPRETGGTPLWDTYPYYNPIETMVGKYPTNR